MATRDTQNIALAGRNLLATSLQLAGVEVARPERDHGIDLIAYLDNDTFQAVPIQLKVSSNKYFGVWPRYAKFLKLVLVFIWDVSTQQPRFFALTHDQSVAIAEKMGWTETRSYRGETKRPAPGFDTNAPSVALQQELEQYEVKEAADWKRLFSGSK